MSMAIVIKNGEMYIVVLKSEDETEVRNKIRRIKIMFEKASRLKLRFFYKGACGVEDLWDLSLEELDSIFKSLNKQLKDQEGDSLLGIKKEENLLQLKVDIIRHIVKVKLEEIERQGEAILRKEKKQKILALIEKKQNASLEEKSIEDLNKMIDEL